MKQGIRVRARVGQTVRSIAQEHNIPLYGSLLGRLFNCRGRGLCGACCVRVEGPPAATNSRWTWEELRFSDETIRMACQCKVRDDVEVTTQPR